MTLEQFTLFSAVASEELKTDMLNDLHMTRAAMHADQRGIQSVMKALQNKTETPKAQVPMVEAELWVPPDDTVNLAEK